MDLLDQPEKINLADRSWRIYSRNPIKPAHYIARDANVINSALTDGDEIYGHVEHCVVSNSVVVEAGATVIDSILMPGSRVCKNAHLERCIVGINTVIGNNVQAHLGVTEGIDAFVNPLCSEGITVFQSGLVTKDDLSFVPNSMIASSYDKSNLVVKDFSRVI